MPYFGVIKITLYLAPNTANSDIAGAQRSIMRGVTADSGACCAVQNDMRRLGLPFRDDHKVIRMARQPCTVGGVVMVGVVLDEAPHIVRLAYAERTGRRGAGGSTGISTRSATSSPCVRLRVTHTSRRGGPSAWSPTHPSS